MHKIVEAVIRDGDRWVPLGLMNVRQALGMRLTSVEFSHPAYEAGNTDIFIDHDGLSKLIWPGRPAKTGRRADIR
jgi:hypothetical protein